ncbi:hypothetical protein [Amycolatopsis sp. RTGN1]|uniref:hypothetical protein n=1 Tax=Amycolatopsis ponsaeliensis TaxID=2992142 RepID=UPI00254C964B|nr:hypothetical protein [Amycolatopsis sp. RTGN1]
MLDDRHLLRMSDDVGLLEHACGAIPRREHGYCLDDAARGLVVLSREPDLSPRLSRLQETLFAFTAHAHESGRFRNRLGYDRGWQDAPGLGDWWGRALWGLGSTAAHAGRAWLRAEAHLLFDAGARRRSPDLRAMVFAALGAAEVLTRFPADEQAPALLRDAVTTIGPVPPGRDWPWPQPRLEYANAAVAEVLVAAGALLPEPGVLAEGLRALDWLVDRQTRDGRLSVVPAGGRARHQSPPGFDQQPIEVAALATACARAHSVTGDPRWAAAVELARAWFLGANDAGTPLLDRDTGGCGDGLRADGVNRNQGAESMLAMLATFQLSRRTGAGALTGAGAA